MAGASGPAVATGFDRLYGEGTLAGMTPGQWLNRFVARRDEAAFEALVGLYGPMVLGVCRGTLRDRQAAEDAFQATFLVLARRAATVRDGERLGPWLHRVARRVARRAEATDARRRARERPNAAAVAAREDPDRTGTSDDLAAIHEELDRLPEKYRAPLVLCYLEGLTHEQAAGRLRWPVGSVKGRLSRARDLLRRRLARRGFEATAGALAMVLARDTEAAVPAFLTHSALRAASGFAAGTLGPSGASTASAVALARGVLMTMHVQTLKRIALGLAAAGLVVAGAGRVVSGLEGEDPPAPAPARGAPTPAPAEDPPDQAVRGDDKAEEAPSQDETLNRLVDQKAKLEIVEIEQDTIKDRLRRAMEEFETALALTSIPPRLRDPSARGDLIEREDRLVERVVKMQESVIKLRARYAETAHLIDTLRRELASVAKPGDVLRVEVLEALPGRPITGERVVRPDGTISLEWYGDLPVAGLSRPQIKVKVVEHFRKVLDDQVLGLVEQGEDGRVIQVDPADTTAVFVDHVARPEGSRSGREGGDLGRRLDLILDELKALRRDGH